MLTRLSTAFLVAILMLMTLLVDWCLCHTTQSSTTTSTASHHSGDMTSLIVVLSFVAVIALIGMAVLLYYCYCASPPDNKDKNNANDLERGTASYELPSDEQQERVGSDKQAGHMLLDGGFNENNRSPIKPKKKKKRNKDACGDSKETLQTRQRRPTPQESNSNERRAKAKDAPRCTPKKAHDNNKPKERQTCHKKQEGDKKRKISSGRVQQHSPFWMHRAKPKGREHKSRDSARKVSGGRHGGRERDSNKMSNSKVYGEGLDMYRRILKSVHSVKSVSQYFQNNN